MPYVNFTSTSKTWTNFNTGASVAVGTFATAGIERVLKPNTAYLLRITNNDAAACKVAVYTTFYEGELSSQN